ncbi:serine/threonine-protein kinase [Streptomyces tendae]|uniref:serine/threonine-protein kinase n=1 Tax=Streptomyces tendae TaxID=1932 RepID=UPI0037185E81
MRELTGQDPASIGGFRLLRRLGQGGMGRVYLAADGGGGLLAVKVVHPEYADDREFRRRFRREVSAAARVRGPGLAGVVAADTDAQLPWLATEFIPGLSLAEAVTAHGALPADACHRLAVELAGALGAVHGAGMVHRDLKPSNVILAADGARLIDFGIARATDDSVITHTGQTVGTPGYIAPEVLMGHSADPRADIFALGAVLAYANRAAHPFGSGPAAVVMARPLTVDPDLSGIMDEVLAGLVRRCLAREPQERPSLSDIAGELGAQSEGEQAQFWIPATVLDDIGRRSLQLATLVTPPHGPAVPHPPTALPEPPTATAARPTPWPVPRPQPARPAPRRLLTRRRVLGLGAVAAGAWGTVCLKDMWDEDHKYPRPTVRWQSESDDLLDVHTAADGAIYAGSKGKIHAIDADTGEEHWVQPLRANIVGTASAADGLVCFFVDKTLTALDARTGKLRWDVRLGDPSGPPSVGGDLVYATVGTDAGGARPAGSLRAFDARNGRLAWTYDPYKDNGFFGQTLANDTVYVSHAKHGEVHAVNATTGNLRWRARVPNGMVEDVSGSTVFALSSSTRSSTLQILDAATGERRRSVNLTRDPSASTVSGSTLYCDGGKGGFEIHAVDGDSGHIRWKAHTGSFAGPPVVGDGLLGVSCIDEGVYGLELDTGAVRWLLPSEHRSSPPVISNGLVYTSTFNGPLYALEVGKPTTAADQSSPP